MTQGKGKLSKTHDGHTELTRCRQFPDLYRSAGFVNWITLNEFARMIDVACNYFHITGDLLANFRHGPRLAYAHSAADGAATAQQASPLEPVEVRSPAGCALATVTIVMHKKNEVGQGSLPESGGLNIGIALQMRQIAVSAIRRFHHRAGTQ